MIPLNHRKKVLETSHYSIFDGHLETAKTLSQIQVHFYWPGMYRDVLLILVLTWTICCGTTTWMISGLKLMLETSKDFGQTIRPSKTFIACEEIPFLGYVVKQRKIIPEKSLVNKCLSIPSLRTKCQAQLLLGLVNCYYGLNPTNFDVVHLLVLQTKCIATRQTVPYYYITERQMGRLTIEGS